MATRAYEVEAGDYSGSLRCRDYSPPPFRHVAGTRLRMHYALWRSRTTRELTPEEKMMMKFRALARPCELREV
ncbi:MAG: hypothetical protein RLZZ591_1114 [Pseudomonadota bacterium]